MHFQENATDYFKDNYAKVRDTSVEMEEKVVTYARNNPLKAIGFSVLAGMLLSKLFRSNK